MNRGYFITFEGGEGSGKTTQIALLSEVLSARGLPVIHTREPGGTMLGDQIRNLILNGSKTDPDIDPRAELFLYLASRAQHLNEVIQPALKKGRIVLCDRFSDATLAYQGAGRGLPQKSVEAMTRFGSYGIEPDLTFLLDIDVKSGLARLKGRAEVNRLDEETCEFHEAVYRGYQNLAKSSPDRIKVIDATGAIQDISREIAERVDALFS